MQGRRVARGERKRATREAILRAARTEFARAGYVRCSTQVISAAAAVAHGTVFSHFGDKAHLYMEVVRRAGDQLAATLEADVREQSLGEFVRRLVARLACDDELCRLLVSVGLDARHPGLQEAGGLLHGRLFAMFRDSQGAKGGAAGIALAEILTAALLGLLMGRAGESAGQALAPLVRLGDLVEGAAPDAWSRAVAAAGEAIR